MRVVVLAIGLAGCGFQHGSLTGDDGSGDAGGSGSNDGAVAPGDVPTCGWSYTPTNFEVCPLPAPVALNVTTNMTLDTAATTLPKLTLEQSDGSSLVIIHLSTFDVQGSRTLTLTGSAVVFAVDGDAHIDGTILVGAGASNATQCAQSFGAPGADSTDVTSGGGGGGGGGAAEDGGDGTNGAGSAAGQRGDAGTKIQTATFTPLRGGCHGGVGGRLNQAGSVSEPGRGGGALQISTNAKITVAFSGALDASGRGGAGAQGAHVGAGGGGSGGSIFLEGPHVQLDFSSHLCADGGSGGEGGGNTVGGNNGSNGACNGGNAATTANTTGSNGGNGGRGSYWITPDGGDAGGAAGEGGGGGGGGAVGWIRVKSPDLSNSGAVITPVAI